MTPTSSWLTPKLFERELYEFVYPCRIAQQKSTNAIVDAFFVGDPYEYLAYAKALRARTLRVDSKWGNKKKDRYKTCLFVLVTPTRIELVLPP